jgi:hypothetical protein
LKRLPQSSKGLLDSTGVQKELTLQGIDESRERVEFAGTLDVGESFLVASRIRKQMCIHPASIGAGRV